MPFVPSAPTLPCQVRVSKVTQSSSSICVSQADCRGQMLRVCGLWILCPTFQVRAAGRDVPG